MKRGQSFEFVMMLVCLFLGFLAVIGFGAMFLGWQVASPHPTPTPAIDSSVCTKAPSIETGCMKLLVAAVDKSNVAYSQIAVHFLVFNETNQVVADEKTTASSIADFASVNLKTPGKYRIHIDSGASGEDTKLVFTCRMGLDYNDSCPPQEVIQLKVIPTPQPVKLVHYQDIALVHLYANDSTQWPDLQLKDLGTRNFSENVTPTQWCASVNESEVKEAGSCINQESETLVEICTNSTFFVGKPIYEITGYPTTWNITVLREKNDCDRLLGIPVGLNASGWWSVCERKLVCEN